MICLKEVDSLLSMMSMETMLVTQRHSVLIHTQVRLCNASVTISDTKIENALSNHWHLGILKSKSGMFKHQLKLSTSLLTLPTPHRLLLRWQSAHKLWRRKLESQRNLRNNSKKKKKRGRKPSKSWIPRTKLNMNLRFFLRSKPRKKILQRHKLRMMLMKLKLLLRQRERLLRQLMRRQNSRLNLKLRNWRL